MYVVATTRKKIFIPYKKSVSFYYLKVYSFFPQQKSLSPKPQKANEGKSECGKKPSVGKSEPGKKKHGKIRARENPSVGEKNTGRSGECGGKKKRARREGKARKAKGRQKKHGRKPSVGRITMAKARVGKDECGKGGRGEKRRAKSQK